MCRESCDRVYVGVLSDLSPAPLFYNIPQCVHVKPQACKNRSEVLSFIRCVRLGRTGNDI